MRKEEIVLLALVFLMGSVSHAATNIVLDKCARYKEFSAIEIGLQGADQLNKESKELDSALKNFRSACDRLQSSMKQTGPDIETLNHEGVKAIRLRSSLVVKAKTLSELYVQSMRGMNSLGEKGGCAAQLQKAQSQAEIFLMDNRDTGGLPCKGF